MKEQSERSSIKGKIQCNGLLQIHHNHPKMIALIAVNCLILFTKLCSSPGDPYGHVLQHTSLRVAEYIDEANPKRFKNVWIIGDVRTPQHLRWQPELTVVAAIQNAGGFNWRVPERVFILRQGQRLPVLLRPIFKKLTPDPKLQPGDTVEVPK